MVLLCYSSGGLPGLRSWAAEVRRSTTAPIVLVRTMVDRGEREEMMEAMAVAEEIGASNWEETSAMTGQNVELAFSLCGLAVGWEERPRAGRRGRPNTLALGGGAVREGGNTYEDPDTVKGRAVRPPAPLRALPLRPGSSAQCSDTESVASSALASGAAVGAGRGSDTDSLLSPQSRKSLVLEGRPRPEPVLRPHSSQSAQIRPSRLYRHSLHRLSGARLKPVAIPLSPNCDTTDRPDRYQPFSDTSSMLSPTDSTASSILPPFRNSRVPGLPSPSSSSSAFLPFSPVSRSSSDRDSVSSHSDSLGEPRSRAFRTSRRPTGCGWRIAMFDSHIEEVEEEQPYPIKPIKPCKLVATRSKKERCTLM